MSKFSPSINCSSLCLHDEEGSHISPVQWQQLSDILNVHENIFAPGGGPTSLAMQRIDTGDEAPATSPLCRVSLAKKEIIRREIKVMLKNIIVKDMESEWASPLVLIHKKNGEVRFCVDYRKLNKLTRTNKYPFPVIDELFIAEHQS